MKNFNHFRDLLIGHRPRANDPSRVGAMVAENRPSVALDRDTLPVFNTNAVIEPHLDTLRTVTQSAAPSVGRIDVKIDNDWHVMGTCFRVTSHQGRIVTARHVLKAIIKEGAELTLGLNKVDDTFFAGHTRPTRIVFEANDSADEWISRVIGVEWGHALWDIALLTLEKDCPRPSLEISETDPNDKIVAIGYPTVGYFDHFFKTAEVFPGELGVKRASFGTITDRKIPEGLHKESDVATILHDASTLKGNSGSPVLSLSTEKVIGLHHLGHHAEKNTAIDLRDAMEKEPALAARLSNGAGDENAKLLDGGQITIAGLSDAALLKAPDDGEESGFVPRTAEEFYQTASVAPDRADDRDLLYRAPLVQPKARIVPLARDLPDWSARPAQRDAFSCTGFALASAIDIQLHRQTRALRSAGRTVSPAMLYALATQYDEFLDDLPGGSSLRGAIKGFFHHGACAENLAPYVGHDPNWHLDVEAAKDARNTRLGAYYRLRPRLHEYQLAVQEAGAVLVSAHLHDGWQDSDPIKTIRHKPRGHGAHAFVIIGYDDRGFLIRNSWGDSWGQERGLPGCALWTYEDWGENLIDGWVVRLAPNAPRAFYLEGDPADTDLPPQSPDMTPPAPDVISKLRTPREAALVGHLAEVEPSGLSGRRQLGQGLPTIRETALYLGKMRASDRKYKRGIALILHDPTMDRETVRKLSGHFIRPLKKNFLYPFNLHYGADWFATIKTRAIAEARLAVTRSGSNAHPGDAYLERRLRPLLAPLLKLWHRDMNKSITEGHALWQVLATLGFEAGSFAKEDGGMTALARPFHLITIGAGWDLAHLLVQHKNALGRIHIETISRLGPPPHKPLVEGFSKIRIEDWHLGAPKLVGTDIPGYSKRWAQLVAKLEDTTENHAPLTDTGLANLAELATDANTLNACLRHIREEKPRPSQQFQDVS